MENRMSMDDPGTVEDRAADAKQWLPRLDPGRSLRAVRRARVLSQRELAALARVPRSTLDRIESGSTDPRLGTITELLAAAGYRLVITDQWGHLLCVEDKHERLRDAAFRRFPAHLEPHPIGMPERDGWWGWRRIAWVPDDPTVPTHFYWRRWQAPDYHPDRVWNDAT
jgi:transcriptional regulator with XRE-family HTH domain